MIHPDYRINNVVLTLINEGSLYNKHLGMARSLASRAMWMTHIRMNEWKFARVKLNLFDRDEAATALMNYYFFDHDAT